MSSTYLGDIRLEIDELKKAVGAAHDLLEGMVQNIDTDDSVEVSDDVHDLLDSVFVAVDEARLNLYNLFPTRYQLGQHDD